MKKILAPIALLVWVFSATIVSQLAIGYLLLFILGPDKLKLPVWTAVYSALTYAASFALITLVPAKIFKKWRTSREELGLKGSPTWTDIGLAPVGYIVSLALAVLSLAAELKWPLSVSMTITKANLGEATDMFVAAALSGASRIQMGAMMAEGRGREHLDLMLTRQEWEGVKASVRGLPDAHVPYSFCEEFICECRDQPQSFREKWSEPNHRPCPAGKAFGVVGPNGRFRACLHAVEVNSRT